MKWYEIQAKADVSEVWLYDEIGLWGVGAKEFIAELNAVKSPRIDLHINSPGGEVFDGAAIYNALRRHPAEVRTFVDGLAASIASVIALAGDPVVMAENALYMMHNPSGLVLGTADDMRKTAAILDKVRDTMIGAYAAKSGQTDDEIRALLDAETWFTAGEAVEAGFADEVAGAIDLAACTRFVPTMAKLGYKRIPRALREEPRNPTERELERALRDAGCSAAEARTILANGAHQGPPRDAGCPAAPAVASPPRDAGCSEPARGDRAQLLQARTRKLLTMGTTR